MQKKAKHIDHKTARIYGDIFQDLSDTSFTLKANSYLARTTFRNSWFQGKCCLDAGCGAGIAAVALARIKETRVYAVDFSEHCLAIAHKRLKNFKRCSLLKASVLELPFKDNSFNFINCNGVVHHLADSLNVLTEFYRVLSPYGWLFLGVYGAGGLANEYQINIGRVLSKAIPYTIMKKILPQKQRAQTLDHWYAPIRHTYRETEVIEALKTFRFQNIKRLSSDFYRKPGDCLEKLKLGPDGMYMHFLAQKVISS